MDDILSRLRQKFIHRCAADRVQIGRAWAQWETDQNPEDLDEILRLAHGLAGTGGTLGFDPLSKRAIDVEVLLEEKSKVSAQRVAISALLTEIDALIAEES